MKSRRERWEPPLLSKETLKKPPFYSSPVNKGTKVQIFHQAQHSDVTGQILTPPRGARGRTTTSKTCPPLKDMKQQPKVGVTELKEKERDESSEKTRPVLALASDPRVCHPDNLSDEERAALLNEALKARALVVTMLYQDGTTQLDAEQVNQESSIKFKRRFPVSQEIYF